MHIYNRIIWAKYMFEWILISSCSFLYFFRKQSSKICKISSSFLNASWIIPSAIFYAKKREAAISDSREKWLYGTTSVDLVGLEAGIWDPIFIKYTKVGRSVKICNINIVIAITSFSNFLLSVYSFSKSCLNATNSSYAFKVRFLVGFCSLLTNCTSLSKYLLGTCNCGGGVKKKRKELMTLADWVRNGERVALLRSCQVEKSWRVDRFLLFYWERRLVWYCLSE